MSLAALLAVPLGVPLAAPLYVLLAVLPQPLPLAVLPQPAVPLPPLPLLACVSLPGWYEALTPLSVPLTSPLGCMGTGLHRLLA